MKKEENVHMTEIPKKYDHSAMYIRDQLMPCIAKYWEDEKKKKEAPEEEDKPEVPTEVDVDAMMLD